MIELNNDGDPIIEYRIISSILQCKIAKQIMFVKKIRYKKSI